MSFVEVAAKTAKDQYMSRVWAMSHEQLFHELMRVHAESAKLLSEAQAELDRLRELVDGKAGLERPAGDGALAGGIRPESDDPKDRDDARIVVPITARQTKSSG